MLTDTGTKPDGYSWISTSEITDPNNWVREKMASWRADGMQHARVTHKEDDSTLWLEVWKERPAKEAPFDPPYTANWRTDHG